MPVAYFRFPPPSADLRVTVTASDTTVTAGQQVSYAISITNAGDATASAVSVTDTLPLGVTLVAARLLALQRIRVGADGNFRLARARRVSSVTLVAVAACGVANGATLETQQWLPRQL